MATGHVPGVLLSPQSLYFTQGNPHTWSLPRGTWQSGTPPGTPVASTLHLSPPFPSTLWCSTHSPAPPPNPQHPLPRSPCTAQNQQIPLTLWGCPLWEHPNPSRPVPGCTEGRAESAAGSAQPTPSNPMGMAVGLQGLKWVSEPAWPCRTPRNKGHPRSCPQAKGFSW